MGDFDSVKIGVCDCYWTPVGETSEIFLGLTKGGVTVTYTPEFHEITVDQYGKTPIDQVLIGETIVAKIPLAETDMNKLKMFSPTGNWLQDKQKLTFGSLPGQRMGVKGGKLRLHPIAYGSDTSEDVTIYKAINKAPFEMNYKMDDERLYSCEFNGMIEKRNTPGSFLWEIGQSNAVLDTLLPDYSNLEALFTLTGQDYTVTPGIIPNLYGTADATHPDSFVLTAEAIYNYQVFNVTDDATITIGDSYVASGKVVTTTGGATAATVLTYTSVDNKITTANRTAITAMFKGADSVAVGDIVVTPVTITWGGKTHIISVRVIV